MSTIKSFAKNQMYFRGALSKPRFVKKIAQSFFEHMIDKKNRSLPMNVNIVLTSKCNLKCQMCFFGDELNKKKDAITIEDIKKILKQFQGSPTVFILTGGEPFTRKDIFKIIELIKKSNHICGIVTNGSQLVKKKIDKILQSNLDLIIFSLLGPEKIHNAITKNANSYSNLISSIKYLTKKQSNIFTMINSPIINDNVDDLMKIIKIGESLNVDSVRFNHLSYLTKNEFKQSIIEINKKFGKKFQILNYKDNVLINPSNIISLKQKIINRKNSVNVHFHPYLTSREILEWYSEGFTQKKKCVFTRFGVFINHDKEIYPCQYYKYSYGNLNNSKFPDIWNSQKAHKFRKTINNKILTSCKRCTKF